MTDPTTDPPADDTPTLTLGELATNAVIAKMFGALLADRVKIVRDQAEAELLAAFRANGTPTAQASLPGVGKVGTLTVPLSEKSASVIDPDKYAAWVEDNYPTEVEYVVRVRPSFLAAHLKGLIVDDEQMTAHDPKTGALVDGLRINKGGQPLAPRLTVDAKHKRELIEHVQSRPLDGLLVQPAAPVPALEDGQTVDQEVSA